MLERIDYTWERHRYYTGVDLDTRPSDLFRKHIWGCFIDDEAGLKNRHDIGIDRITCESDYPHSDSNWPNSRARAAEVLADVPDDEVHRIVELNARSCWASAPTSSSRQRAGVTACTGPRRPGARARVRLPHGSGVRRRPLRRVSTAPGATGRSSRWPTAATGCSPGPTTSATAFQHPELFSSHDFSIPTSIFPRTLRPLALDPPEHGKYRQPLAPLFSPPSVARREPELRAICRDLVDAFAADGACELLEPRSPGRSRRPSSSPCSASRSARRARSSSGTTTMLHDYDDPAARKAAAQADPRLPRRAGDAPRGGGSGRDRRPPVGAAAGTCRRPAARPRRAPRLRVHALHRRARHRHRDAQLHLPVPRHPARPPARSGRGPRRWCRGGRGAAPRARDRQHGAASSPRTSRSPASRWWPATRCCSPPRWRRATKRSSPPPPRSSSTATPTAIWPSAPARTGASGSHLARLEVRIAIEELLARIPSFRLAPGEPIVAHGGGVLGIDRLPIEWEVEG